jgi:hypothetical protein
MLHEILGFHGNEAVIVVLGCDALWTQQVDTSG